MKIAAPHWYESIYGESPKDKDDWCSGVPIDLVAERERLLNEIALLRTLVTRKIGRKTFDA